MPAISHDHAVVKFIRGKFQDEIAKGQDFAPGDLDQLDIVMQEAINAGDTLEKFIDKLCDKIPKLKAHIISKDEFAQLTPVNINDGKAWAAIDQAQIENVLNKFKTNNVWLLQAKNGDYMPPIAFNDPDRVDRMLYEATFGDYSTAVVVAERFQETLVKFPELQTDAIKAELITALGKSIYWLNVNGSDFNELYKTLIVEKFAKEIDFGLLDNFADSFSLSLKVWQTNEKLSHMDWKLVKHMEIPDGAIVEHDPNHEMGAPMVLITTSSSGGCHKTIANNALQECKKNNINCAVINESILYQNDVLSTFTNITFAQLYPVVHQQHGMAAYRNQLMEVNKYLAQYMPDPRPAMFRKAIEFVHEINYIVAMYVTSHYAHNQRFLPYGCKAAIYQVCDYGTLPSGLKSLADVSTTYLPDTKIMYVAPSDTTCLEPSATLQQTEVFKKQSEVWPFPTAILTEAESEDLYNKTVNDFSLSQNKDITRCVIAMGGVGVSELICQYVDNIVKQYGSANLATPMELVVVCGNNAELQKQLTGLYNTLPKPANLEIKVVGMVPNKQFIALSQHSVLISKPGGGTMSECKQNKINVLVHYDPKHPWEEGNVKEVERDGIGKRTNEATLLYDIIKADQKMKNETKPANKRGTLFASEPVKQGVTDTAGPAKRAQVAPGSGRQSSE